jgi:hypothetical protein
MDSVLEYVILMFKFVNFFMRERRDVDIELWLLNYFGIQKVQRVVREAPDSRRVSGEYHCLAIWFCGKLQRLQLLGISLIS